MPAIFLILIVAIASYYLNIPIYRFTRDPLAIAGGHPFLGIDKTSVSYYGVPRQLSVSSLMQY